MGELVAGEAGVMRTGDGGFELGHAVEIAQEDGTIDTGGIKTSVSQYTIKASIAGVNRLGHTTEVADVVIGGTAVDMINGHASRSFFSAACTINSMCHEDMFATTESVLKNQIALLTLCIIFSFGIRGRISRSIHIYFSPVREDTDTNYSTLAVVAIEGHTRLGASADIADEYVVKEEGRAFEFRFTDDFKAASAHSSRGFGCRRSRQG